MAVTESVLSWLYSVLHEYHDPQRTYSDLAQTLVAHPSLAPRTEVYTFESGASALLVTLAGTLPVDWRGTTYRFPLKICIPHHFPQHPPMVYVVPAKGMAVRPGQHVGTDGRVYHPYLRDWQEMWDRASTPEFLHLLQQAFAKEPPVISRPQQQFQQPVSQQQASSAATLPPLPPKQNVPTSAGASQWPESGITSPPPLPPKQHGSHFAPTPSRNAAKDGPPLPLLPQEIRHRQPLSPAAQGQGRFSPPLGAPPSSYQNGGPSGSANLPTFPHHQSYHAHQDRSPVSLVSPISGYSQHPEHFRAHPPSQLHMNPKQQQYPSQPWQPSTLSRGSQQGPPQSQRQYQQPSPQTAPQPQQSQRRQPAPDLLSDPFDVALPGPASGSAIAAPPIPPNPEREHLLHALSASLVQQTEQKVHQNLSAIAPLQAQQHALYAAQERLQGEIHQLERLEQALSSNKAILHRSIQECDSTILTAKSKKQPPIDEVLIAPTMVANQLWMLCAEEAACRQAMYMLQKGVDRGRINGNDFVRQMRGLGRECFLKMALARKCARGMGLETRGK